MGSSVLIDRITLYKLFSTAHVLSYDPSDFASYTGPLMDRYKMSNGRFLLKIHSEVTVCLFLYTSRNSPGRISTRHVQEHAWIERGIIETAKGSDLTLLFEVCTVPCRCGVSCCWHITKHGSERGVWVATLNGVFGC